MSDDEAFEIPSYPEHGPDVWGECQERRDFSCIFFDWFRWIGACTTIIAFVLPTSSSFMARSKLEYYVLAGSLARCAHLMHAIIKLTHEGEFADAAQILNRSLTETTIKIRWMCQQDTPGRVDTFIADGLLTELRFEEIINKNIEANGGEASALEARMLRSIDSYFDAANVTKDDVRQKKQGLPNMVKIIEKDLELGSLAYVVNQKLASHAIHGTWPALLADYLEPASTAGYEFRPRADQKSLSMNYYMSGFNHVTEAICAYVRYFFEDDFSSAIISMLGEAQQLMMSDYDEAIISLDS